MRKAKANVYAYELAKFAAGHGAPDEAFATSKPLLPAICICRSIRRRSNSGGLAFPMPFRASIEHYSREQGLDPFLVAALIRQESEFNTHSISPAERLWPDAGDAQHRPTDWRGISASAASIPAHFLRPTAIFNWAPISSASCLILAAAKPKIALASYNAGPPHRSLATPGGRFTSPPNLPKSCPFIETRGYIQIVMRNADVYRRLYAGTHADIPPYSLSQRPPKPSPRSVPKRAPKSTTARRSRQG